MPNTNTDQQGIPLPDVFVTNFKDLPCCVSSPVHRHPFYELVWVSEYKADYFCDFKQYTVEPNTIAFVAPGQVHHWNGHHDDTCLTIIGFTLEHIAYYGKIKQVIAELPFYSETQAPFYTFTAETAHIFDDLFSNIQQRFRQDVQEATNKTDVLLAYLNLILVELKRVCHLEIPSTSESTSFHITQEFRKLVEDNYLHHKQVQDYADMLGITLNHLVETVRSNDGKTPKQIIQQRLSLEAKRLLVHSQDTIAEISHQLQFNTPTYFGSWFKNLEGMTPLQFRQTATVP